MNAVVTADAIAKKALIRRKDIINKTGLPSIVGDARINVFTPLKIGDYGFAVSPTLSQIVVCRVLEIYSKSSGKGSRHCSVTDSSSITAVSNIAVQVYENRLGTEFREIPHAQALRIPRFDFIQSTAFLCALKAVPTSILEGVKISVDDWNLYKLLKDNKERVLQTLKMLVGRKKGSVDPTEDEEQ